MKQNKETLKKHFETGDKPTQQQYADLIDSYIDAKQPAGEANRRFVIDEAGDVSITSEQQTPNFQAGTNISIDKSDPNNPIINSNNVNYEGYNESGTRVGKSLEVVLGDYDDSGNGTQIEIDDTNKTLKFLKGILMKDTGYTYEGNSYDGFEFIIPLSHGGTSVKLDSNGNVDASQGSFSNRLSVPTLVLLDSTEPTNLGKAITITTGSPTLTDTGGAIFRNNRCYLPEITADTKSYLLQGISLGTLNNPPSSSTDTGVPGEVRYDANFKYECIKTNKWIRIPITTTF